MPIHIFYYTNTVLKSINDENLVSKTEIEALDI
jgi:hypothetical protein